MSDSASTSRALSTSAIAAAASPASCERRCRLGGRDGRVPASRAASHRRGWGHASSLLPPSPWRALAMWETPRMESNVADAADPRRCAGARQDRADRGRVRPHRHLGAPRRPRRPGGPGPLRRRHGRRLPGDDRDRQLHRVRGGLPRGPAGRDGGGAGQPAQRHRRADPDARRLRHPDGDRRRDHDRRGPGGRRRPRSRRWSPPGTSRGATAHRLGRDHAGAR